MMHGDVTRENHSQWQKIKIKEKQKEAPPPTSHHASQIFVDFSHTRPASQNTLRSGHATITRLRSEHLETRPGHVTYCENVCKVW